jgi:hypothetical protein
MNRIVSSTSVGCLALATLASWSLAGSVIVESTLGPGGPIPVPPMEQLGNYWNIPLLYGWQILESPATVSMRVDRVTAIEVHGLQHTWRGDVQIYLENPAGERFNVIVRSGFPGQGAGDDGNFRDGWRLIGEHDVDIVAICFGDSTNAITPCPCAPGAIGGGCANSGGPGATLSATGSTSVAANDLELTCTGMLPASASIFRQSTGALNNGFGEYSASVDGLACLSTPMIRVDRRGTIGASATIGDIASSGAIPANGGTRYYQVTYRDVASYCTSASWNTSNAIRVVFEP